MTYSQHLPWLICLVTLWSRTLCAQNTLEPDNQVERAWFTPSVSVDNDPVCAAVLESVVRRFRSDQLLSFNHYPRDHYKLGPLYADLHERYEWQNIPVAIADSQWYVNIKRYPGCGSGCDTYSFITSSAPLPEPTYDHSDPGRPSTPAVEDFQVYRASSDSLYVAQIANNTLDLLKLMRTGEWHRACSIALAPDLRNARDAAVIRARDSIARLLDRIDELRRREADCGSLHSHSRRGEWMRQSFEAALYRPWSLTEPEGYPSGELRAWAMTGIAEHAAHENFERELSATRVVLSRFYQDKFGWNATTADAVADQSIRTAIGRGFAMGGYRPFRTDQELEIRKALISRAPLETLRQIGATAEQLTYRGDNFSQPADSVLNLAVAYPEGLRYLLDLGLDPNIANDFGKTPLMYAAQQNELASLRILLEHGADPDAATTAPSDRCRYSLETFGVTALHYAVRYASVDVVEALLTAGADEVEARGKLVGTPIDWLRRYAGSAAIERNPNLDDAAVRRIANRLDPGAAAASVDEANKRLLEAESRYAAGDAAGAYHSLRVALLANPGSIRALNDMSIIALKVGSYDESLRSSQAVIASARDPADLSTAWFNVGIACETIPAGRAVVDGVYFCNHSLITPFMRAWDAKRSSASESKIAEQLDRSSCSIGLSEQHRVESLFVSEVMPGDKPSDLTHRLYVKHRLDLTPAPSQLKWTQAETDSMSHEEIEMTPRFIKRRDMQDFAVTEFVVDRLPARKLKIGDQECDTYWGMRRR